MDSTEFARLVVASMPFATTLQIEVGELKPHQVIATMAWAPERCTTGGMLHGGALMAFADTAGAVCAVANLPQGASTSTIESKTNFFRAVRAGTVTATSLPLHVGRTTIVVQTDLTDDDDKLVARVTQTQAVLAPKK
ncbi:aromatic compound degradation protein PaaI [Mycolicibacter terrae]|uniref:Aromatic compound degradation protein PaaI n=1 Tax=Mycolicibacter terrae TaxID=1788 RepID=A0AAD1HXG5_9MYCO|nr:PaaI family thioesterase [Mycolicibacter terrae]ORW91479.1 aromatic compound degradation protein PaaI [Mycolicibacter terrae]BBX22355.1 aromatic compound degradation protein PaaI [Mycolicibacter terrae]SNV76131.1 Putative phenylacetic acid degradation-related protein [Mycolicibacter terrae]